MNDNAYLHDDAAPFTLDELVSASVLLGADELEARQQWQEEFMDAAKRWQELISGRAESTAAFGIILPDALLVALAALSPSVAHRVEIHRNEWWESVRRRHAAGHISEADFAHRLAEKQRADAEWFATREVVAGHIAAARNRQSD